MPKPVIGQGRYMAGLDGLRAISVFAVIAYHLNMKWAQGGLLGVGVFFVLSGYLITDQLIAQWRNKGTVDLKDFWLRRARRLLPALLLMLVAIVAWLAIFDKSRLLTLREEVGAGLLYVSNWWLIFHEVSYFESFGLPSPLGHLWSLAVEEQFYLLWPVVLLFAIRCLPRRGPLVGVTLFGALVSVLVMVWLYDPGTDPSRVYYGTDTRVFALLIGAALAMVWQSRKLTSRVTLRAQIVLDSMGFAALLLIGFMIWNTNEYDEFLYPGGFVLLSFAAAVVVAVLAHPVSLLGKVLGSKPLRWFGVRSYGIYLWHYPIIVMSTPIASSGKVDLVRAAIQVVATILISALSWRYVEEPIRRGSWNRLVSQASVSRRMRQRLSMVRWTPFACAVLLIGFLFVGLLQRVTDATPGSEVAGPTDPILPSETAVSAVYSAVVIGNVVPDLTYTPSPTVSNKQPDAVVPPLSSTAGNERGVLTDSDPSSNEHRSQSEEQDETVNHKDDNGTTETTKTDSLTDDTKQKEEPVIPIVPTVKTGKGITAIGDSVMLDIAPYLEKLLPGIVVDGKIGRQFNEAADILDQHRKEGTLGSRVIIELGTNGPFNQKQLEALLDSLDGAKQIILVNTRVPRKWEDEVNSVLAEVARSNSKVTLVDWYTASEGKSSFFAPDGVHLEAEGSEYYASLVAGALKSHS
ncbi:acyltransferase family protein [Paenibacillus sp. UNC451MF]|uniref:acyltransferase family protein n=1 Tax=Paenibacillus sp. UNC451MF TaxID=1449063 RepID=UPI00048C2273|nr:acyltransferase family protein [Paenibacillus sp. UNC451MF]